MENRTDLFQNVFLKWEKSLKGLSRSIILDSEEASDTVQEAFHDVWTSTSALDLKDESELKNYLFKTVRNKSLNKVRRKRIFTRLLNDIGNFFFPDGESMGSEGVHDTDSDYDFKTMLMHLSDKHRSVLYLRIKEEYSNEEIAHLLDIPVGTVKSRINSGLSILRKKMRKT